MRLFELQDLDALRTALRIRKASANEKNREANVSGGELSQLARNLGLAVPSDEEALIAFKNAEDPQGKDIGDITPQGVLKLKTNAGSAGSMPEKETSPTVNQMASRAANHKPYSS